MTVELDVYAGDQQVVAIQVPPTTTDITPFPGSGCLYGWSLREASSAVPKAVEGSVVAPAALATIVTTGPLPAGTYDISWTVELQGAVAAADANNFQLLNDTVVIAQSVNLGAAGQYVQISVRATVAQGKAVSVQSIGAGTAGVTYTAEVSLIPDTLLGFEVELQGGNQALGESAADFQEADTRWFGRPGVLIEQFVRVHVVSGAVTGVLYIIPNY